MNPLQKGRIVYSSTKLHIIKQYVAGSLTEETAKSTWNSCFSIQWFMQTFSIFWLHTVSFMFPDICFEFQIWANCVLARLPLQFLSFTETFSGYELSFVTETKRHIVSGFCCDHFGRLWNNMLGRFQKSESEQLLIHKEEHTLWD